MLIRFSKKPPAHFGLFFRKLPMQIMTGAAIGAGLTVLMMIFGSFPAFPNRFAYILFSQLLVGLSEETFWRGFVLQSVWDISASKDQAIFFSSLLFGLSHFPIGGSVAQVIAAFLIGILLAVLRTEFKETVGIPAVAVGHAISNIF